MERTARMNGRSMRVKPVVRWSGWGVFGLAVLMGFLPAVEVLGANLLTVTDMKGGTVTISDGPRCQFFSRLSTRTGWQAEADSWLALPLQMPEKHCVLVYFELINELKRDGGRVTVSLADGQVLSGAWQGPLIDDTVLEGKTSFGEVRVKLPDIARITVDGGSIAEYMASKIKAGGRYHYEHAPRRAPYRFRVTVGEGRVLDLDDLRVISGHAGGEDDRDFLPASVGSQILKASLRSVKRVEFQHKPEATLLRLVAEDGGELDGTLYNGEQGFDYNKPKVLALVGLSEIGPVWVPIEQVRTLEVLLRMTEEEADAIFKLRIAAARLPAGEKTALEIVNKMLEHKSPVVRKAAEEAIKSMKPTAAPTDAGATWEVAEEPITSTKATVAPAVAEETAKGKYPRLKNDKWNITVEEIHGSAEAPVYFELGPTEPGKLSLKILRTLRALDTEYFLWAGLKITSLQEKDAEISSKDLTLKCGDKTGTPFLYYRPGQVPVVSEKVADDFTVSVAPGTPTIVNFVFNVAREADGLSLNILDLPAIDIPKPDLSEPDKKEDAGIATQVAGYAQEPNRDQTNPLPRPEPAPGKLSSLVIPELAPRVSLYLPERAWIVPTASGKSEASLGEIHTAELTTFVLAPPQIAVEPLISRKGAYSSEQFSRFVEAGTYQEGQPARAYSGLCLWISDGLLGVPSVADPPLNYPPVIWSEGMILSSGKFTSDVKFEVTGAPGQFVSFFFECDGATHLYASKVSPWKGFTFEGDEAYPLTFKKVKGTGYVYLCGRGTVTLAEGKTNRLGYEDTLEDWLAQSKSDVALTKEAAAQAIAWLAKTEAEKQRAASVLIPLLKDESLEVRRNAAESLGKLGVTQAVPALRDLVGKADTVWGLKIEAKGPGTSDFRYTKIEDSWVADVASESIAKLSCSASEPAAKDSNYKLRAKSKDILAKALTVAPTGQIYTYESRYEGATKKGFLRVFDLKTSELSSTALVADEQDIKDIGFFLSDVRLAMSPKGTIWITGNEAVYEFEASGKLIRKMPYPGRSDTTFYSSSGLATDAEGNIYLIQKLVGETKDTELPVPGTGITIYGAAKILIFNRGYVVAASPDGQIVRKFGGEAGESSEMKRPVGVAVDDGGKVYVADADRNTVQVLNKNGTRLRHFSVEGPPLAADLNSVYQLELQCVAVPGDGSRIYVGAGYGLTKEGQKQKDEERNSDSKGKLPEPPSAIVIVFDSSGSRVTSWAVGEKDFMGLAVAPTGEVCTLCRTLLLPGQLMVFK